MSSRLEVALYLRNAGVADVDLRHPEWGNPGVGGTQFGFVSLAYYLKKYCQEAVEPVLYAQSTDRLPASVTVRPAGDVTEVVRAAAADGCDMLLVRVGDSDVEQGIYDEAAEVELPVVAWAHNFPTLRQLDAAAAHPIVKRIVCVGREELDRHRDHPAFEKSTFIYNGIDPDLYAPETHVPGSGTTIVYMGALIRYKGFHRLARMWPEITARVPDARLVVIGSGKLYNRENEVGTWGVASETYEQDFRPYLADSDGLPDSSVEFKGNLGTEKIPLLRNADVGIPNPPKSSTETFCLTGVEFQAAGTPVVSAAQGGLLDTVRDGETGILVRSDDELVDAIVELLQNRKKRERLGRAAMEFTRRKFAYREICEDWRTLFERVGEGLPVRPVPIKSNLFHQDKWLREAMRLLKKAVPRFRGVPPLFATGKRDLARHFLRRLLPR